MILTAKEREALLQALQTRFEKNMRRHAGIAWAEVLARLDAVRLSQRALSRTTRPGAFAACFGSERSHRSFDRPPLKESPEVTYGGHG
jgi:hypothetical protein